MIGKVSHLSGLAAEDAVARHYGAKGYGERARRWRGPGGEIDLILEAPDGTVVFVEVKAARSTDLAVLRLSDRQRARILASAEAYLAGEPDGTDSAARIDVALVGAHGAIHVIENAFG